MKDYLKTILLLGVMSVILIALGGLLFGSDYLWISFIFVLVLNFISYYFSEQIALKSNRAIPLDRTEAPEIYSMVEQLSSKMGIPTPGIYYKESPQANAFATGRNPKNSSVVMTNGLIQLLDKSEIEGVIAHELAHIKNRDILTASIASVLASVITFASRINLYRREGNGLVNLIVAIFVPIAGVVLQLAISRQREFEADETAAETLRDGKPLADALIKINDSVSRSSMDINPSYSNLYIANPAGIKKSIAKLFSTHPPVNDRVERLMEMRF